MKPYPEYKDSGVSWLGRIPAHWEVKRTKFVAPPVDEKLQEKPSGSTYIGLENIESGTGRLLLDEPVQSVDSLVVAFQQGDVLFGKLRPYLRKAVNAPFNGVGTTELLVLRPGENISPSFLRYRLLADDFISYVNAQTYGVKMPRANAEQVGNVPVGVPTADEQVAIADFLDRQTGKIDALIAKKERLIELLKEKRTALTTKAVTEGLDSTSPSVVSGINAVARIPKEWTTKPCNYLFRERDERGYPELPILEVSIHTGVAVRTFSADKIEQKSDDLTSYKRAVQGDIAFNKMRMWQGAVGVVPVDGLVSPDYTVAKPLKNVCVRYYELLFRTSFFKTEINRHSHGIVPDRNRLYWDSFKQIKVLAPPYQEQLKIVAWVDEQTARLDALAFKIRTGIERLREYRTALISAAVTGQIDVRVRDGQARPVQTTTKLVSPAFRRTVFAAEIIEHCHEQPTFGHVKFQKILHLAEYHLGLQDFDSNYYRQAAGPYDNQMLRSIDRQLETSKWFRPIRSGPAVTYTPMEKSGGHRKYFDQYWGEHRAGLEKLITLLAKFNTEQCEIVSTLYAVWNDFLLAGESFDDEAIVDDAIAWHPEKQRIERDRWLKALTWMRQKALVPRGTGKPIKVKK